MAKTDATKTFSEVLTDLIIESGMEYRPLAAAIGISQASLSKYAANDAEPGLTALVKPAEYFDVSIDYLAGRTDTRNPEPDMQGAVEYTGLSEQAIDAIRELQKSEYFEAMWVVANGEKRFDIRAALKHPREVEYLYNSADLQVPHRFLSWMLTQEEFKNAVLDLVWAVDAEAHIPEDRNKEAELNTQSRGLGLIVTHEGRAKLLRMSASQELVKLIANFHVPTELLEKIRKFRPDEGDICDAED